MYDFTYIASFDFATTPWDRINSVSPFYSWKQRGSEKLSIYLQFPLFMGQTKQDLVYRILPYIFLHWNVDIDKNSPCKNFLSHSLTCSCPYISIYWKHDQLHNLWGQDTNVGSLVQKSFKDFERWQQRSKPSTRPSDCTGPTLMKEGPVLPHENREPGLSRLRPGVRWQ